MRGTYVRWIVRPSRFDDALLAGLYDDPRGASFGGERTPRANTIRLLIDEIRALRRELADAVAHLAADPGDAVARPASRSSLLPEPYLARLYDDPQLGGGGTGRARVVRELIDEIRTLRHSLAYVDQLPRS